MSLEQSILLKNANLVDVEASTIYPASVLIEDGIISEVIKGSDHLESLDSSIPKTIDLTGKWIIPGLIDMHVHIKEKFAPHFVASGITTVRNTGGNVLELKKLMKAGNTDPTPRVFSADRIIDGPPGLFGETSPWSINIDDPDMARREVRRQIEAGADLIKVYGMLSEKIMTAVVQEASKFGIEVSCDLIHAKKVNAVNAARMGIKWNEHASGFIQAMYPQWNMSAPQHIWQEVDWKKPNLSLIKDVCLELLKHDVIICPTMILFDQMDRLPDYWKVDNEITKKTFQDHPLIGQWEAISQNIDALKMLGKQSLINKAIAKTYFELGGTVVAGTDTPAGVWTFPGMALHRELELFVKAGFPEMDALRAATIIAAESLHEDTRGVIQKGAIADILVLNSDPIEDIKNTKNIDWIIKGGKVYSQEKILRSIPSEEYINRTLEEFLGEFEETMIDFIVKT
ncbi:amidohydrolase family protein [Falsibacillus albus]|uniref:Imidazolonepropionase n=1 Tax=Falsibacillus albus TaxID=2478915 RepID=A0A3L7JNK7_9BACI|nr:amidohydrolase family protein [Falsibacillus albus]RLQ92276.1 imidazolonepropionase [Falsibacillus albus]